jgi:hypothetical protein
VVKLPQNKNQGDFINNQRGSKETSSFQKTIIRIIAILPIKTIKTRKQQNISKVQNTYNIFVFDKI